jgi:hypothetical protein
LPIDEIKIDRSFVDALGTERDKATIVRSRLRSCSASTADSLSRRGHPCLVRPPPDFPRHPSGEAG